VADVVKLSFVLGLHGGEVGFQIQFDRVREKKIFGKKDVARFVFAQDFEGGLILASPFEGLASIYAKRLVNLDAWFLLFYQFKNSPQRSSRGPEDLVRSEPCGSPSLYLGAIAVRVLFA
jgi:hypothetical protein